MIQPQIYADYRGSDRISDTGSVRNSFSDFILSALIRGKIMATELKQRVRKIITRLKRAYPDAKCSLNHSNAFELLIATILSAQCTDARVNMVTPELFRRWPTAREMAGAPIQQLEKVIQSTGFFRNKAKNIKAASQGIVDKHDGEVPRDMDQLVALPGVVPPRSNHHRLYLQDLELRRADE